MTEYFKCTFSLYVRVGDSVPKQLDALVIGSYLAPYLANLILEINTLHEKNNHDFKFKSGDLDTNRIIASFGERVFNRKKKE